MNKLRTLFLWALCALAALTGCDSFRGPDTSGPIRNLTSAIERLVGITGETKTSADNAATSATNAQNAANATHDAITGDGGVQSGIAALNERLARIEACDRNQPDWSERNCDGDSYNNGVDACPNQDEGDDPHMHVARFDRRGCLDTDSDGDGIGDSQDACLEQPKGEHEDAARLGCPDIDTDRDGFFDSEDECHLIPVHSDTTPDAPANDAQHNGCPANAARDADTDGDGVRDYRDQCPNEEAGDDPHPARLGCPDVDTDGDGHPDRWDGCPNLRVQRLSHWNEDADAGVPAGDYDYLGCPRGILPTTRGNDRPLVSSDADAGTTEDGGAPEATDTTDAAAPSAETDAAVVTPEEPTIPEPPAPVAEAEDAGTPTDTAAPATTAAIPTVSTVSGNATALALSGNAAAFDRFCRSVDRRTLAAIRLAGTSACGEQEAWCFRLVNPSAEPALCERETMAAGCVTPSGSINPCVVGAERTIFVRCGTIRDCTPANVAAAITRSSAPRHSSRSRGGASLRLGPFRASID